MYSIPLNYLCALCVPAMGRQGRVEVLLADLRFVYGTNILAGWVTGFHRLAFRGSGCSAQCHSDETCMLLTT